MKRVKVRLKRSVLSEVLSLLPLAVLAFMLFSLFPSRILVHRPLGNRASNHSPASCAFVSLDEKAVEKAMQIVRSSLSVDPGAVRNLRTDLSLATVSEEYPSNVFEIFERTRYAPSREVDCEIDFIPVTFSSPPPVQIEAADEPAALPFPKHEMLKID